MVGSKGKGTAATYAAATLAAAGVRTGLITSPPFRTNRERVRIDGTALCEADYLGLSRELARAIDRLGSVADDGGYLSPTGCFTISGILHFARNRVEVIVLEEGLGGASDEVALFSPRFVAVTRIFEEHLGVIGRTLREIANDLVGVIVPETEKVFSLPQGVEVWQSLTAQAEVNGAEVELVDEMAKTELPMVPGLSRMNAGLGVRAGRALLGLVGASHVTARLISPTSVALPGRLSVHHDGPRKWIVDAPVNDIGVAAALDWTTEAAGRPEVVLLCMPDIKDVEGSLRVLTGQHVVGVRAGESYLRFSQDRWPIPLMTVGEAFDFVAQMSGVVLAVGTISFVGEVLEYLRAPCDTLYSVGPVGDSA